MRSVINWRAIIKTGLAYGVGLMVGNLVSQIVFVLIDPELYSALDDDSRLAVGIFLFAVVSGVGGALGGYIGGRTLPAADRPPGKQGWAWRSAVSFGVLNWLFLFLIAAGLALLAMRASPYVPINLFMQMYLPLGMIVGAFTSLILGLTTVGWRHAGTVTFSGAAGFGLGGAALGAAIWAYLESTTPEQLYAGDHLLLLIGLFAYGFLGGSALGFAYDRLARNNEEAGGRQAWPRVRYGVYGLAVIIVVLALFKNWPRLALLSDLVKHRDALLTETIAADSVAAHWQYGSDIKPIDNKALELDLSIGAPNRLALAWIGQKDETNAVRLRLGQRGNTGEIVWESQIDISDSPVDSNNPSVAIDASGAAHVVWFEENEEIPHYARCSGDECTAARPLTETPISCSSGETALDSRSIDIAAAPNGKVMVVWSDDVGGVHYHILPEGSQGCVPIGDGVEVSTLSLSGQPSAGFSLVFDDADDEIWMLRYSGAVWDSEAQEIGVGKRPEVLVSEKAGEQAAWCGEGNSVVLWREGHSETLSELSCFGTPYVSVDGAGQTHVLWQSDEVIDSLGAVQQSDVLYETIEFNSSWSEPAIVARLGPTSDYGLVSDETGNLHLAWTAEGNGIYYAWQRQYECDPQILSGVESELYKIAKYGGYRPIEDVIPFCRNRYEKLIFTPAVDPAFSDVEPTPYGAYDDYARLLQSAEYEVLFTTMVYAEAAAQDSPGAVLARGIVDLYEKVKADPGNYPRGMLVRILLGNSPAANYEQLELGGGLWYVIEDLREAGLEKMVDAELGWRVEVGNYAGQWPHSHVKAMIIDGETTVVSGFNHEYKPLPKDHPSGKGFGDTDTGLVVSGPVAQQFRQIFDQLWTDAVLRYCPDLDASESDLRLSCTDSRGISDHVPEVLRYSLTDEDAIAFSMYRNQAFVEADEQLEAAFGDARESIDLADAMFSMEWICNLNHFYEVCDFGQALPYMQSLMDAAENGARVRILLAPYPTQHVENVISVRIFYEEAVERGVADRVEIRMFDDLLHSKSAIIDGEFVIVGSQNLHWTVFGKGNGLSELSLGVQDPQAASQYQSYFDYLWERSVSLIKPSSS